MKTLDLHGVRHAEAERLVENFILISDMPCRIVTGNSSTMQSIVTTVASRHELRTEPENHWNLGSLIITERM